MKPNNKIALFLVSLLLGSMVTVQFSTVHSRPKQQDAAAVTTGDYVQLTAEMAKERERQNFFYSEIANLEAQIAGYKGKQGDRKELVKQMAEELEKVKREAGQTQVNGDGIIITIEDDLDAVATYGTENQVFLDAALYQTVNYLNGHDAQAISINGHRIVSFSTIRSISKYNHQINTQTISSDKIVIKAVGNIEQMKVGLYANRLKDAFFQMGKGFEITDVKDGSLEIPPFERAVEFKYAQPEGDKKL
ncbi:DUF881 domain-containing protein [Tumebacillus sp. DT12]|uniref:DUF881 domain-containing protein n=1 Tax=Tumebacillus lacus TaxID=2995335 RepID=A0ABT3X6X5_9BACL|nr:DUF881 domain-containing protein [Tumebacillus lacus]MCX7571612.1 DUF881 domain-containing protein [Tumebacillus lacus]